MGVEEALSLTVFDCEMQACRFFFFELAIAATFAPFDRFAWQLQAQRASKR